MTASGSPAAEYLRFLAWAVAVAVARRPAGVRADAAAGRARGAPRDGRGMRARGPGLGGGGDSDRRSPGGEGARVERLTATLASMGLRLLALFALTASVALSGWFERRPLLIWIAIGYIAQLVVDTRYATRGF